jgi:DME family drug/metabolite transporter
MSSSTLPAVRRHGTASLLVAGTLWGTGGLTGSLLARATGLAPLAVAGYRLAAGGALLVGYLTVTGRPLPTGRAAWTRIGAIGLLAALFQGSFFGAVALTSVSLATLVTIGTAPVLVLAVERATGRRRIDARMIITVALALAGLGLLVGTPSGARSPLAGVVLAVVAAAGFATVTLVGSVPVAGLDELTATGYGFVLGAAVLLPVAAGTVGVGFTPGGTALGLLAVLGTGPTAVAYTLYFRGLRTVPAGTAAVLALLEPLTGAVLAALVLGDRLGATGVAGAVILGMAVILATY